MKRSDNMSKEEVVDFCNDIASSECCDCPIKSFCEKINGSCSTSIKKYLFDEVQVKTVSRWQTIKYDEDLAKMGADSLCENRHCDKCVYNSQVHNCFVNYLLEKIEVEETE